MATILSEVKQSVEAVISTTGLMYGFWQMSSKWEITKDIFEDLEGIEDSVILKEKIMEILKEFVDALYNIEEYDWKKFREVWGLEFALSYKILYNSYMPKKTPDKWPPPIDMRDSEEYDDWLENEEYIYEERGNKTSEHARQMIIRTKLIEPVNKILYS